MKGQAHEGSIDQGRDGGGGGVCGGGIVAAEGAGDGRQGAVPEELRGLPPADRQGIPGAFPALAGSKFVQGKSTDVASVLLKGRGGMPDFSDSLSDRDIATVLTFVRSNWGNKADGLSEADVGTLRTALGVDPFGNSVMSNKH
jgi:hypothetical protein